MNSLNSWNIDFGIEYNNELLHDSFGKATFLLNTNQEEFSLIEKYVYDVAMFHFNRLNIKFDENKYIEFWYKNNTHDFSLHFDRDEYDYAINKPELSHPPLLSCITYLDDDNYISTIITDINQDKRNKKDFSSINAVALSFSRNLKQITFDGGNLLHGAARIYNGHNDRRTILINLWDKRPLHVPYFDYSTFMFEKFCAEKCKIEIIKYNRSKKILDIRLNMKNKKIVKLTNRDIINSELFDDYMNKKDERFLKLGEIIKDDLKDFDTFIFESPNENNNIQTTQCESCKECMRFDMTKPKFKQRFIIPNFFSSNVCDWITKEYVTFSIKNIDNIFLQIEKQVNVFPFILHIAPSILQEITKNYCLDEEVINYNIVDIIITNNNNEANAINENKECDIEVLLLINDDYEGGGIYFEDEITSYLNKGSLIIYNAKTKNSINEIKKGTQYFMKFYIEIFTPINDS